MSELKNWKGVVLIVIILLVVAGLVRYGFGAPRDNNYGIQEEKYQAVFLTNGQVYFGKIENHNNFITMSDIYYLKAQENLQSGSVSTTKPDITLIKLGNELHGPEDFMNIDKGQILFWENLKEDGRVVKAIREYQKK